MSFGIDRKRKVVMMKSNPNMKTLWGKLLGVGDGDGAAHRPHYLKIVLDGVFRKRIFPQRHS